MEAKQERIEATQNQHTELLKTILATVTTDKSVPLPVLKEILARMEEMGVALDPALIEQRLRAKADEYLALKERLGRLSDDDPRVIDLRNEAADFIAKGDFDSADERLSHAKTIDLDAVGEMEAVARRRRISVATTRAERGAAARLNLKYRTAAEHYAAAVDILPQDEPSEL
jgi:hypothetical protein